MSQSHFSRIVSDYSPLGSSAKKDNLEVNIPISKCKLILNMYFVPTDQFHWLKKNYEQDMQVFDPSYFWKLNTEQVEQLYWFLVTVGIEIGYISIHYLNILCFIILNK